MEDHTIVDLYWQRDESAIRETEQKYHRYLTAVATRVLPDPEDVRESLNDAYLRAWESIPPQRPQRLGIYLGRLVRQVSIARWRRYTSQKRGGTEYALTLSELEECLSIGDDAAQTVEAQLLADAIGAYLRTLPAESRILFVRRYYYMEPIRVLADHFGWGESRIKSLLWRTRRDLAAYLKKEGFDL